MKKIYISFLIVFVVLAAIFTIFKNMTSGVINTALIAVGEGTTLSGLQRILESDIDETSENA